VLRKGPKCSYDERKQFIYETRHAVLKWVYLNAKEPISQEESDLDLYEMQYGLRLAKAAKKFEKFHKF
jgi:hypothetical protein